MAVYKVIQDIEAEDKLIGFLTLKGFIYALIAGTLGYINFRLLLSGGPPSVRYATVFVLFFPMALFGVLAAPIGKDQPTEVWLLSHVQFLLKRRKKVWDQMGLSQLVTITVPKKIEKHLTKEFSQTEVKSRLKALADTLDSRGWATKNATVDINGQPGYFQAGAGESDRLIGVSGISQTTPVLDLHDADDILDEDNNAAAGKVKEMMLQADAKRKQEIVDRFNAARQTGQAMQTGTVDYRFLDEQSVATPGTGGSTFVGTATTAPGTPSNNSGPAVTKPVFPNNKLGDPSLSNRHPHFNAKPSLADERRQAASQAQELEKQRALTSQAVDQRAKDAAATPTPAMTAAAQTAKIDLAQSGSAFSVSTLSQMANRKKGMIEQISPNEVVISLH